MFINEKCGNLKVVVDGGELTVSIMTGRGSQRFYKPMYVDS